MIYGNMNADVAIFIKICKQHLWYSKFDCYRKQNSMA